MNTKTILAVVVMLVNQTACAVSDDPHEGGLFGYWHGTSSGRYEQRQQEMQAQLDREQAIHQQLSEQSTILERERAIQDRKLATERREYFQLENKLTQLNADINNLHARTGEQKHEVASLKEKIRNARARIEKQQATIAELDARGGSNADPDQVRILKLERDRLADEYRKLNKYYQALSNAIN